MSEGIFKCRISYMKEKVISSMMEGKGSCALKIKRMLQKMRKQKKRTDMLVYIHMQLHI